MISSRVLQACATTVEQRRYAWRNLGNEVADEHTGKNLHCALSGSAIIGGCVRGRVAMDAHSCGISAACTLRIEVKIWRMPVEVADPISFDQDRTHASYDPD
jgi:hypothetical protein